MTRTKTLSILVLLIVSLIILKVVFNCFIQQRESFTNGLEQQYEQFVQIYNPFMTQWQQALQTYIASNQTQQPLTSPSQVSQINPNQQPSEAQLLELNQAVQVLSSNNGQTYPSVQTYTFPETLPQQDPDALSEISQNIPTDSQSYINALNWMNSHLEKSHGNLKKALQGNYTPSNDEGFISEQCQKMEQCYNEIQQERLEKATNTIQQKLQSFFSNQNELLTAWQKNQELVNKAKEVQAQAQSGELLKQVNVQDSHYYAPYQMPAGADNLKNIQQNNPSRYAELQQQYSQWATIKSLMDQINGTLG
jgi:hypothetical protein